MEACLSYSCVTNPLGVTIAELEHEENIFYADIDISEMITAKQYHDIIGHYTRMDAVSLNLCQDEDRPLWYTTRMKGAGAQPMAQADLPGQIQEIQQNQQRLTEELNRLTDLVSQQLGPAQKA